MSREQILQEIKIILLKDEYMVIRDRLDELSEKTSLIEDFTFDSMQIMDFFVQIENKFSFSSESREINLDMFDRISTLIDFIEYKISTENKG